MSQKVQLGYASIFLGALLLPLLGGWIILQNAQGSGASHVRDSAFERYGDALPRAPPAQGPGAVVLTFDGGERSHVHAALLLERHGYRGTFFVAPGEHRQGQHFAGFLSADEVEDLARRGHDVQSRGWDSAGLHGLAAADAEARLRDAQARIGTLRVGACTILAHPGGMEGVPRPPVEAVHAFARDYGYWTKDPWFVGAPADPYRVPALPVVAATTPAEVALRVDAARAAGGTLVLAFGPLADGSDASWSPAQMEAFLDHLDQAGVRVLTFEEAAATW